MSKEVPKAVIDNNRNIVLQTLDTFGRTFGGTKQYPTAASTRGISQDIVLTRVKPVLQQVVRGREDEIRKQYGKDIFRSEAFGTWPRYQLAFLTTALHLIDIDGTPFEELKMATFCVMDLAYMRNYLRTEGTKDLPGRPVPIEKAMPNSGFGKLLRKLLIETSARGHIDFDVRNNKVYKERRIDSVELSADFWERRLHISKSGWKRWVCGMKVGMHAPELEQMYNLIRNYHLGSEYGIKPRDPYNWFLLTGPTGAGFSFVDPVTKRVYLQYEKAGLTRVAWNEPESEAVQNMNFTIGRWPFVSKELIKSMFPQHYSTTVAAWNKSPEVAPIEIAGCYVSKQLGIQLKWASKQPLGLEQHNAREVLAHTWKYLSSQVRSGTGQIDLNKVEEASNVVITILADLSAGKVVSARNPMELRTIDALSPYVEPAPGSGYVVKKGMEDAVRSFSLYAGVL
jgi:hypothetical protein